MRTALAQNKPTSIPSPRGLQYHRAIFSQNPQKIYRSTPVNLWIIPAHDGQPARGLGWDGVVYDLQRVGAPTDWRADVEAGLKPHVEGTPYIMPAPFEFACTPITLDWLQQLKAPDLLKRARLDFKKQSWGRSNNANREYCLNLRDAALGAFSSRDWNQAKRQWQTLLAALPSEPPLYSSDERDEVRAVLADIERRLHPTPRPTDKVAALIYDLQDVGAAHPPIPRDFDRPESTTVTKLVDLGDVAVAPLIDTLEKDDRLSLVVSSGNTSRSFSFHRGAIGTVRGLALGALQLLMHHTYDGPNNWRLTIKQRQLAIAAQIRAEWNASKDQSPTERVFQTLSSPTTTPERLVEAAKQLVQIGPAYNHNFIRLEDGTVQPVGSNQTFFGEPLRAHRTPSVSDVLEARIKELNDRALNGKQTPGAFDASLPIGGDTPDAYGLNKLMSTANTLAFYAAKWDDQRGASHLSAQLDLTKRYVSTLPRPIAEGGQLDLQNARRQFLAARLKTPFRAEAFREYATYLQSVPFGRLPQQDYSAIWLFPTEPAIQSAAHSLFDAPKKPFQEAAQWKTDSSEYDGAFRLLDSPLLNNPAFKAAVLRELTNRTVIGTLRKIKPKEGELHMSALPWSGETVTLSRPTLEQGKMQPLRVCDLVGFYLHRDVTGNSQLTRYASLVDVSLPTAQRNAQITHSIALVKANREVSDEAGFDLFDF